MRPLGAIVLGSYLDRHWRRKGLILTLALMAIGTLSIAVTPSYARIGPLAPLLVMAGRLVHGFSVGVIVRGPRRGAARAPSPARNLWY
jgi:MFS family permease